MRFRRLLIANRGEIALRIARTARRLGLHAIAVYSDADRGAPYTQAADEAVHIGGALPAESYLNMDALLAVPADAVHPGYGFHSENAAFAERVIASGRTWIGPPPDAMGHLGDKQGAKKLARTLGIPVLPGYEEDDQSDATLAQAAEWAGFPLLIKAAAGGGGRGMRVVREKGDFPAALATARSEAMNAFGDGRVLLERLVEGGKHVEVQFFADAHGNCVHLGERDCSVQRRHQKLVEESPSPSIDAAQRAALGEYAVLLAKATGYVGAGTAEFLLDREGKLWFLEVNTRLQVEHPVTEAVTGLDLVEWQLRVADGQPLPLAQAELRFSGHAIEARLCAEDPARNHLPQAGTLHLWSPAPEARTDHALASGQVVPPHYDSLLAKVIVHADTRDAARERLAAALDATVALGLPTNKAFLASVLRDAEFAAGRAGTDFLDRRNFPAPAPADDALRTAALLLAGDHGEWTGWSNSAGHAMRARFGGAIVDARCTPEEVLAARQTPHAIADDAVHLAIGGDSYSLRNTLYDPPEKAARGLADGRLTAPMNGKVKAVAVQPGASVPAGQPLVVLEAMKMEHGLTLPATVRVTAVHAKAGAQVAPGQLLVEFEAA